MEDLKALGAVSKMGLDEIIQHDLAAYFRPKFLEFKTPLFPFPGYAKQNQPAPPPCCGECGRPLEDEDEGY